MNIPNQLLYTEDHEWISIENNIATVGITDFAQNALGDIVFVELPETETQIEKSHSLGVVESIKSVSDIYAPLSGKVLERNEELIATPELCNQDAYQAWMIKIELEKPEEKEALLSAEKYQEFCNKN